MSGPVSIQKESDDETTRIRAILDPIERDNASMISFGKSWENISQLFKKV